MKAELVVWKDKKPEKKNPPNNSWSVTMIAITGIVLALSVQSVFSNILSIILCLLASLHFAIDTIKERDFSFLLPCLWLVNAFLIVIRMFGEQIMILIARG